MQKRSGINIDPRCCDSISLWDPEKSEEMSFVDFIKDIYYSIIQNNSSLELLLNNYYARNLEMQHLREKIWNLEDTIEILKTKIEILEKRL